MFADYVKIAAKAALIIVVMAAVLALFTLVQIPTFNITALASYLVIAYTFACHWCPIFPVLWPIALGLIALEIGLMTFKISAVAWKWIFKINE